MEHVGIRDNEIKRLILYAKSLGAKVVIRNYTWDASAEVHFEPKYVINVNKRRHRSKTDIIMTFLHELSHLKYAILNNTKFSDAFIEEVWELEDKKKKISKKKRKEIVKFELESLELMTNIASELNLKISMKKVLRQKEHDQDIYVYFEKYGEDPNNKWLKDNWKKLKEKYK